MAEAGNVVHAEHILFGTWVTSGREENEELLSKRAGAIENRP